MNVRTKKATSILSMIAAMAMMICLFSVGGFRLTAASADADTPAVGDVNGDGSIDMKDVLALRMYLVSPDESVSLYTVDVNSDGSVDMKDVLLLRRFLAHMEDHLGNAEGPSAEPTAAPTTLPTTPAQYTWPIKTPIDAENPRINFMEGSDLTLGVWWWRTSEGTNESSREMYFDFLEANQVTEIYYYGANRLSSESARQTVHTFVQAAMAHGFRVAALFDNQAVVREGNTSFTGIVNSYQKYREEYPDDALYSIHCDIEPQAEARASREATAAWVQNYVDNFVIEQIAPARAQGVCVELDIATGWWRYGVDMPYTGSATHEYDGETMNFNDILAHNCDCMCMMSYRDTAREVWAMADMQREAADAAGTKIVYGVEIGSGAEGDKVDFSAESKEIMYTELSRLCARMESAPPVGGGGLAIHHAQSWYALRDTL